jgi:adenine-specific DNA-methyltransferase
MKKPIEYTIEPAKGQALLSFQGRRLPDKIELFETVVTEEVRQYGQQKLKTDSELNADFRNLIIHGDCLSACAYLKSENIKVDLVYIDPPFASGANYAKKITLRTGNGKAVFEKSANEIGEEIMYGDIWQKEDYLNWLYERLLAIREVMNNNASIYVHLGWHIGHYVKILLDEVFGEENFKNEIIWYYEDKFATGGRSFDKNHDVIFWYSKNADDYSFEPIIIPKKEASKRALRKKVDGKTIDVIDENGKKIIVEYTEKKADDVWSIPRTITQDEDVNYNTQKPDELLKRIFNSCSTENFVVADFFMGSGTSAKVANDLGKKFIACDIGINAIQTTRDRLVKAKAEFDVLKINDGVRLFRNPAQTVAKLFSLLDGYKDRAELGLGEFWDGGMINKRGTFTPVRFIGIDRKLTKELVDVIIEEVIGLEENHQEDLPAVTLVEAGINTEYGIEDKIPSVKIIYAYKQLEVNQDYVNKTIKQSKKTSIKAELVSLDELLSRKADVLYTPDNAVIEMKQEEKLWIVEIKKYFSSYLKNKMDDFNNKKVKPRQKTLDENGENGNGNDNEEEKLNGKSQTDQGSAMSGKIQISESGLELIEAVQFDTVLRKDGVWTSNLNLEDKAGVKEKIKAVYKLTTDKFKMKIRNISGDEIIVDSSEIKNN